MTIIGKIRFLKLLYYFAQTHDEFSYAFFFSYVWRKRRVQIVTLTKRPISRHADFLLIRMRFYFEAVLLLKWVPGGGGVLSLGVKRGRGVAWVVTYPHLVPRSKMSSSCTSSPHKRPRGA
jgi:hypothetical protein